MLNHTSLEEYYMTAFEMVQHHKYSWEELEQMIPFEKSIFVDLLLQHLKEEKQRLELEAAQNK